jgi:metal-dependent amidase/aminoacylase/carboxypeptidase family protein
MPMSCDETMAAMFKATMAPMVGEENYRQIGHRTGSTDMGDLSQVMPILHPYIGGARGSGHGADYEIVDKPFMYIAPAKALASMAIDLMYDGAAGAKQVLKAAKPPMMREQYLTFQRSVAKREVYEG